MRYSIDTSAILDGWTRHYPPDIFPALWGKFEALINDGVLRATEEVFFELERKDDGVFNWVKNRPQMFIPINEEIQVAVNNIMTSYEGLVDERRNRSIADPFVIALAQIHSCKVVTGEIFSNNLSRPRIPNVCRDLDIPSINFLQLVREERWVFNV